MAAAECKRACCQLKQQIEQRQMGAYLEGTKSGLYMQEQCAACARNALFTALSIRAYGKGVRLPNFGIIHIMHSTNKMAN
eukprot:scaffold132093_cov17-Tisochrysis_lutea.AAC.1